VHDRYGNYLMRRLIRNCYCMIDANKILQVDVLDLIFEGRNKEYGAYELRTNYGKRLLIAIGSMLLLCACFAVLNSFAGNAKSKAIIYVIPDVPIEPVNDKEDEPKPPPVEPPKQKQIQVEQFTPPKITHEDVKPEEMPPPVADLENVKIGTVDVEGEKGDDIVAPPLDDGSTGVMEKPKAKEPEEDPIVLHVQIESEYPGGLSAWLRYLTKNLPKLYSDDLVERGVQGRVIVQFIVDKEGNVSEVQGIEGPAELREIGEAVIRKSGKWTPAIQNGRQVKSYKRQPIVFALPEE
jgi:periplasmic protein TonB